jgi:hypothetical protein
MLLHYLQQRRPPVLPVLQELYDTPEQPQSVVEGHNCWFYDDLKNLVRESTLVLNNNVYSITFSQSIDDQHPLIKINIKETLPCIIQAK